MTAITSAVSFAVTDMTAITSAVLFHSESKGSGFYANERP